MTPASCPRRPSDVHVLHRRDRVSVPCVERSIIRRVRARERAGAARTATVIPRGYVGLATSAVGPQPSKPRRKRLRIGKITVGSIDDWTLSPGVVTSWHATPAAAEKARQAPVSSVPVSYMQAPTYSWLLQQIASGLDYSRQIIATCEVPGRCDVSAMNQALNAYLRRHDTYRSWFEQR